MAARQRQIFLKITAAAAGVLKFIAASADFQPRWTSLIRRFGVFYSVLSFTS